MQQSACFETRERRVFVAPVTSRRSRCGGSCGTGDALSVARSASEGAISMPDEQVHENGIGDGSGEIGRGSRVGGHVPFNIGSVALIPVAPTAILYKATSLTRCFLEENERCVRICG